MSFIETSFIQFVKFVKLIQKNVVNLIFVNCLRFTKRENRFLSQNIFYASAINTEIFN